MSTSNNTPKSDLSHRCPSFLRIDNTLYNMRFVKTVKCTDQECDVVFANTENTDFVLPGLSYPNRDKIYTCMKKTDAECYKKLKNFVESHD